MMAVTVNDRMSA